MEMGYVSAIIVKDMSRLGRDYLQVGYYTDTFFPDHNIRFIAINDCVDSDDGENELAPFRNVMNEMYAKILAQQEYCGDVINFKTYSKSFKNKARISNSKENWAIFKDRHEQIIDRETFEQVQKLTGKTKR